MNKYRVEVIFKTFIEVEVTDSLAAFTFVRAMGSQEILKHPSFEIDNYWPDSVYGEMFGEDETEADEDE